MAYRTIRVERLDSICVIRVDNPPVNALSQALRAALLNAFEAADADPDVRAVVLLCEGKTFIAGADIREFGRPPMPPLLPDLVRRVEAAKKPSVAVIHGAALGGGLELALGCHYRIARRDARLGLPEVRLGLLPGAGGTQRLPRLAGVPVALNMIVSGEPVEASEAQRLGIVDSLFRGDPEAAGLAFARALPAEGLGPRRSGEQRAHLDPKVDVPALLAAKRDEVDRRMPGLFSPQRCIDAIEASVQLPLETGLRRERELFVECMASPQRSALVYRFQAERRFARQLKELRQDPSRMVGARLTRRYREAVAQLLDEVADPACVDAALRAFGMAEGPLRPPVARLSTGAPDMNESDALIERPLLALIDEGACLLAEGQVQSPGDIDHILIRDCGFPPQRGGPMFHADGLGLARVLERMRFWQERIGAAWTPAPLLQQLAAAGRTFADLNGNPR